MPSGSRYGLQEAREGGIHEKAREAFETAVKVRKGIQTHNSNAGK
jgi:hypothetical protein